MTYVFVVLAGLGLVLAWYLSSIRRKKLRAWASAHGLRFDPGPDASFERRHPEFGCLRRGHSRRGSNIAQGTRHGRSIEVFDYRYVTGHGKNRNVHRFSGVIVSSSIALRPLQIRAENVFDRVAEFFGAEDIDFESAEFSRAFHVRASDKRWAYDVLHQRTIEFLLSMPRFSIQLGEREMIVWRGRRFAPETFETALTVARGILERLPRYVVRNEGGAR